MEYRRLSLDISPPLATLTLTRVEAGNRIDARLLRELQAATEAIGARRDVALAVLRAEGADFCAGWDDEAQPELEAAAGVDPFGCVAALACPVLAALKGRTASGGLELALACDIRIAAEDTRISLPDVSQGALPRAGGSQRLLRVAGRAVAASMLLLGDELDAQAAYRAGVVSRVIAASSLDTETEALARRIAANGPLALRYAKEAMHNGSEMTLDQALRVELDLSVILQTTRDRAEGVQAFLEKRPPEFEGR